MNIEKAIVLTRNKVIVSLFVALCCFVGTFAVHLYGPDHILTHVTVFIGMAIGFGNCIMAGFASATNTALEKLKTTYRQ